MNNVLYPDAKLNVASPDWILQKQTDGIVSLDNTSPCLMYFSLVYLSD